MIEKLFSETGRILIPEASKVQLIDIPWKAFYLNTNKGAEKELEQMALCKDVIPLLIHPYGAFCSTLFCFHSSKHQTCHYASAIYPTPHSTRKKYMKPFTLVK